MWECGGGIALTAMDLPSIYPFAVQIPNKTGQSVANAMQDILSQMCDPVKILSDNGPEFRLQVFTKLLEEWHIEH